MAGVSFGLFALDGALTGGTFGAAGGWIRVGIAMILLGPFVPSIFFDETGQEFSSSGMWSAARRHWSGVVGLVLMISGVGLIVMNIVLAPDTIRASDWAFAVVFVLLPILPMFGLAGPSVGLRLGPIF
ncbi:MAG: hypothetical protein AB7O98_04795 [Hyphomonadaceae bacterium]